MNIYKVNTALFYLLIKNSLNQVFFIIIAEIEKLQAQKVIRNLFLLKITFLSEISSVNTVKLMIKLLLEYHDYADVFNKQAVKVLPLRRFYNYKIELESQNLLSKS